MADTAGRRLHACPSCAAPLDVPDEHDRWFRCEFCGSVVEDRSTDHGVVELHLPSSVPDVDVVSYGGATTASRPRGALVAGVVVALVGAAAAVVGGTRAGME